MNIKQLNLMARDTQIDDHLSYTQKEKILRARSRRFCPANQIKVVNIK